MMRRSARLTAHEQERWGTQLNPVEEDSVEDDDPLHPWCFASNLMVVIFMIMCDQQGVNCYKWFHGVCVGISPEEGRRMETHNELFICPSCAGIPALPTFTPATDRNFCGVPELVLIL